MFLPNTRPQVIIDLPVDKIIRWLENMTAHNRKQYLLELRFVSIPRRPVYHLSQHKRRARNIHWLVRFALIRERDEHSPAFKAWYITPKGTAILEYFDNQKG